MGSIKQIDALEQLVKKAENEIWTLKRELNEANRNHGKVCE